MFRPPEILLSLIKYILVIYNMLSLIVFTLTAFSFFFLSSSFFFLLSGIRSSSQLSSLLVKHKSMSLRMNTNARTLREPEMESFILNYLNEQKRAHTHFQYIQNL